MKLLLAAPLTLLLVACGASDGGPTAIIDPTGTTSDITHVSVVDDATVSITFTRAGTTRTSAEVCAPGASSFQLQFNEAHYSSDICQFGGTADAKGDEPLDSAALAGLLTNARALHPASATPCAEGESPDVADVVSANGTRHYVSCGEGNVASGISESIAVALDVSFYGVEIPGIKN